MTLSKSRLWIAGTVAICLVMTLAAWFLLIGPKRAEASELRQETADTVVSNNVLAARVAELKAEFAQLPQRKAELADIQRAMPADPALAVLTRDLQKLAADSGVTLMAITPGVPTVVVSTAAAVDTTTTDGTTVAGATTTAAPSTSTGLAQMPVTLQVVGSFATSTAFLEQVQTTMDRAYLVDGLNVLAEKPTEATGGKPAVGNGDVTLTVTGRVFVLDPTALATGTTTDTPAAPAAAGAADN